MTEEPPGAEGFYDDLNAPELPQDLVRLATDNPDEIAARYRLALVHFRDMRRPLEWRLPVTWSAEQYPDLRGLIGAARTLLAGVIQPGLGAYALITALVFELEHVAGDSDQAARAWGIVAGLAQGDPESFLRREAQALLDLCRPARIERVAFVECYQCRELVDGYPCPHCAAGPPEPGDDPSDDADQ